MATAAVIHPQTTVERAGFGRLAGLAGLAFAVSVAALNIFTQGSGIKPAADADASKVLSTITDNRDQLAFTFGWMAVNVGLLAVFVTGLVERVRGSAPAWARLGSIGAIGTLVAFPVANIPVAVLASSGDELAGNPAVVSALWDMHFATFALVNVVLSAGLLGFSVAAARAKLVPSWFAIAGPIGALSLFAAGLPVVEVAQGSAIAAIGLPGFLMWLVFAGTAGVKMWREA